MTDRRVVVIGAGHNGLVCATYLARAGYQVVVVEAAAQIGGAAITRAFAPGARVSAAAHFVYQLDRAVSQDLALESHGLSWARQGLRTVALSAAGEPLVIDGANVVSGSVGAADRVALAAYSRSMRVFAELLAKQNDRVPPRVAWESWREAVPAAKLAWDLRRLGKDAMREFLRVATMSLYDVLEEYLADDRLKGALALDGVLGTRLGPRSGGTVLTALHRMSGGGRIDLPRTGLGALTSALAAAAKAAGVDVRTSAKVASIEMRGPKVAGVVLAGGDTIAADAVVSSADPHTTFLKLLGARHLETEFVRRVSNVRSTGTAAKLHLLLSALPEFKGVSAQDLGERLVVAPDARYVDEAFNPAKYGEYSPRPVFEVSIPTVHDSSLAPPGQHVLSAVIQYAPYDLRGGWDDARTAFVDSVFAVLEQYSPGIRGKVLAQELLTPADLEREFGMRGGHWHHAELAFDQFLMLRPVPGAARYATPVSGLYLCGAGCHPGGGVMGTAGRNAARVIQEAAAS
jgi:phytoene dehydrogenase-like protein